MRRHTNHALLLSFGLHIVLMLMVSPFFITHFDPEKEHISAEILAADPEKRVKRRILPPRLRPMPQSGKCRGIIQFGCFADAFAACKRT